MPLTGRPRLLSASDQPADHVVGHVAVDVVGQLDEPEALAERALAPARTGTTGRSAGSGRRRPARA